MTKKSRYLILAACIVFFLLAAPGVLFYVRGIAYDPGSGTFYKTGILAVKSEPKEVLIKLDGKAQKKGAGSLRFLKPGEYLVSLEKAGFKPWTKRLQIEADKVTWANPSGQNIYLFFEKPETQSLGREVAAFAVKNDILAFARPDALHIASFSNPENASAYAFAAKLPVSSMGFIPGSETLWIKTQNTSTPWLLFDVPQKEFLPQSQFLAKGEKILFRDNNLLYLLEEKRLAALDLRDGKRELLMEGVADMIQEGGYFYYLKQDGLNLGFFTSSSLKQPGSLLAKNLPLAETARIIINNQKQAYALLGESLYQVADPPALVADNVKAVKLNPDHSGIAVTTGAELLKINSGNSRPELINRSLYPISGATVLPRYGHAFFAKENRIVAEELDARDSQNEFTLYSGQQGMLFQISEDAKKLAVLDGQSLVVLKIR